MNSSLFWDVDMESSNSRKKNANTSNSILPSPLYPTHLTSSEKASPSLSPSKNSLDNLKSDDVYSLFKQKENKNSRSSSLRSSSLSSTCRNDQSENLDSFDDNNNLSIRVTIECFIFYFSFLF
jgi:hypothetical protein